MKVEFSKLALDDLASIAGYVRLHNPKGARSVRNAILKSIDAIKLFPDIGRLQTVEDVRKIATRKYGYLIYYKIYKANRTIIIVTIRHPARQQPYEDRA